LRRNKPSEEAIPKGKGKERNDLDNNEQHLPASASLQAATKEDTPLPAPPLPRKASKVRQRVPSLNSKSSADSLVSSVRSYSTRLHNTTVSFLKRFSNSAAPSADDRVIREKGLPILKSNLDFIEAYSAAARDQEEQLRAPGLLKQGSSATVQSYAGSESSFATSAEQFNPPSQADDWESLQGATNSGSNPYSRHFRALQNKSSSDLPKIEGSPPEENPPEKRISISSRISSLRRPKQSTTTPELSTPADSTSTFDTPNSLTPAVEAPSNASTNTLALSNKPKIARSNSEPGGYDNMTGDKNGGWRSRIGGKKSTGEGPHKVDVFAESMHSEKRSDSDSLHQTTRSRERGRNSSYNDQSTSDMKAASVGGQDGVFDRRPSKPFSDRLEELNNYNNARAIGGSVAGRSMAKSKLERMMGADQSMSSPSAATDYSHKNDSVDTAYQPALAYQSQDVNRTRMDVDETCCPVCLELLSFRLAGEKSHVTPTCGHALHHACFTAVYGPPEAILAAQKTPGRATPPGMCGVCRKMIVLGDEGENRRQNSEFVVDAVVVSIRVVIRVGFFQTVKECRSGKRRKS
jgi:hypothetical protein